MSWFLSFLFAFCPTCSSEAPASETEKPLRVFISFSVPLESWKDLSHQLEKTEGYFVIRGLPENSFEKFAEKLIELRSSGINAPIDIDPESFEKHGIQAVPTIVLEDDKITGNLRLDAALRKIVEAGDSSKRALELLMQLESKSD